MIKISDVKGTLRVGTGGTEKLFFLRDGVGKIWDTTGQNGIPRFFSY